ncbi:hypothetical protein [Caldimonas thermodepolymerans]|uniref:Uncharacterized protein n=1 Tax=Caldimonas thermodepolymerans TaxID=215580 RepID=A0AA46DDT3_9BURK|nr:hypothetical protein [Caldimonas thermodepolymerans]TCP06591.1 hypothetical protein EV676_10674 [Caldimonas thermodepolymerans]UZG49353.1 hypothetical protein ONS87_06960 [Caldimonas thermodepolymerans]
MRKASHRRRARFATAKRWQQLSSTGSRHLADQAREAARQALPCAHKVRHTSMEAAATVAIRHIEDGRAEALTAYRCRHCRGWHLTTRDLGARMPRLVAKHDEDVTT